MENALQVRSLQPPPRLKTTERTRPLSALPERNWIEMKSAGLEGDLAPDTTAAAVRDYVAGRPWVWPSETIHFFCDLHADAEAFARSLNATDAVRRFGPNRDDFALTPNGRQARFIVGGDCFDKGPSTLRLLRTIRHLIERNARVDILAGNHDVRTLAGLKHAGQTDVLHAHLFVRMGRKAVPFLHEVFEAYCAKTYRRPSQSNEDAVRARLFPQQDWFDAFPRAAEGLIPPERINKELKRIAEKSVEFEVRCREFDMTLDMLDAALEAARFHLFDPSGEFFWFTDSLILATRAGSFLFVHAGIDDVAAQTIASDGIDALNQAFHDALARDIFGLYYGPLGNVFRTKYRSGDWALSEPGATTLMNAGIYGVIHGHRNLQQGQRLSFRGGLLNFECDASVDTNTRKLEGLTGPGGAVVTFSQEGRLVARSADAPYAKVFAPAAMGAVVLHPRPALHL